MIETERLYRESIERDKVAKAERDRPRIEALRQKKTQEKAERDELAEEIKRANPRRRRKSR